MDHNVLLLTAALIVGISKGGMAASAALVVPALSLWMNPLLAAGILLPIYVISDVLGVWLYRKHYSRPNIRVLVPAGLAGVVCAAVLTPYISTAVAEFLAGVIGLFYCGQTAYRKLKGAVHPPEPFRPVRGAFWGVLTGITSFVSHSGAPPFQMFVLPQKLGRATFAGTTTIVFAAINLFKLPAYLTVGMLQDFEWGRFLIMAGVAAIGVVLGRVLVNVIPERLYLAIVQTMLLMLSLYLIAKPLGIWAAYFF